MGNVIIVESPSKSKTITSYLGKGYTVLSSKGHINELSISGKDGLGIDIENDFKASYNIQKDKKALVEQLKNACKGNKVYLATDPDREGEAIAYHLANHLELDLEDLNRIEFHEITKDSIREALNHPHKIDMKMVDSQECRRLIDRIIGFRLSKLLQKKIGSNSAGRVQSAVLKLIVDLEKEIKAFVPVKYFEMEANFNLFKLKLAELNGQKIDSKNRILDKEILETLNSRLMSFVVSNISNNLVKRNSYPAFTTSTLQQEASIHLGMSPKHTMSVAQGLYEGKTIGNETVGLITYMRTDSTRLADVFVNIANNFILETYGQRYLGSVKIKSSKNMQDAHEGIRPTSIYRKPDDIKQYLSIDEYRLYKLIYNRTLASLMAPAVFNSTKVEFTNTDSKWTVSGQMLEFDGYLKVYGKSSDDENQILPNFNLGDSYNSNDVAILEKETQPKSRYTEASIIKEMDNLGIGRPSTYSQTINTLKERKYVNLEKKSLVPTEQGILTINRLDEYFPEIVNSSYTADLELDLDEIANGNTTKLAELNSFYTHFTNIFEAAKTKMDAIYPIKTEEICPLCGDFLVIRKSRYGEFISCGSYPTCDYKIKEEENPDSDTHILCPTCFKANIVKRYAKKGSNAGGYFYACNNYPKCKTTYKDEPTASLCPNCGSIMLNGEDGLYCSKHCNELDEAILCPNCKTGHLLAKTATRGKNMGKLFYACNNFPTCKTTVTDKPTKEVCPNCGSVMLAGENGLYCMSNCNEKSNSVICPACGKGHLIERVAKTGKNKGNVFYGCSNYPYCKNVVSKEEFDKLN